MVGSFPMYYAPASMPSHDHRRARKQKHTPPAVAKPPTVMDRTRSHRNDPTASLSPADPPGVSNAADSHSPVTPTSSSSPQLPFSQLPVRKSRIDSVTSQDNDHPPLPPQQKLLRQRRSIGADFVRSTTRSPSRTSDDFKRRPSVPRRPSEGVSSPTKQIAPLRMLSSTFHKGGDTRQADASPHGLSMASRDTPYHPSGYSTHAVYNTIHETTNKRLATLDYLRKVHEGQVYYFSTVSYNGTCMSPVPSLHPTKLGRRATNYVLLGTSMTPLLEYYASNPVDYLRALASLLAEYETYNHFSMSENGSMSLTKARMGAIFKRGVKSRRTSTAADAFQDPSLREDFGVSSIADSMPLPPAHNSGHDFQYLQLPSLPFEPDFNTSYATLTDILMEAYAGLLALISSPEACVPGIAEAFAKTDKQMRKVMFGGIVTEFCESTRTQAKSEVGGLGKLVLSGLM